MSCALSAWTQQCPASSPWSEADQTAFEVDQSPENEADFDRAHADRSESLDTLKHRGCVERRGTCHAAGPDTTPGSMLVPSEATERHAQFQDREGPKSAGHRRVHVQFLW